jgi:hypothetical protein
MGNRPAEVDWRTYLDALLFPLKIYTALAVIWIAIWHALLPVDNSDPLGLATTDFYTFVSFVAAGYILSGLILMAGGIIQLGLCSRRAWIWSLSFAVAALIIGIGMAHYAGGIAQFSPPFLNELQAWITDSVWTSRRIQASSAFLFNKLHSDICVVPMEYRQVKIKYRAKFAVSIIK